MTLNSLLCADVPLRNCSLKLLHYRNMTMITIKMLNCSFYFSRIAKMAYRYFTAFSFLLLAIILTLMAYNSTTVSSRPKVTIEH